MFSPVKHQNRIVAAVLLSLTALTWAVFGQTLGHQFVNYDDPTYVLENAEVTAGLTAHGLVAAFTHLHAQNWHPLTTISQMVDCQLFGVNPAGHHFMNVLLHTVAVLLLFLVLQAMTGKLWRSAFVAAVFAIHPLRAESVAWVAERKDVLSALFFMLTLGAYLRFVRQPSLPRYLLMALFFALGLMSKAMLVTLPLLLLLLDYWPLQRNQRSEVGGQRSERHGGELRAISRLVVEKIPLLVLALTAAVITLIAQGETVAYGEQRLPLAWRLSNGLVSYVAYIGKMLWPAKLAVFYPHTVDRLPLWQAAAAFLFVAGMTALSFVFRRTRPYVFVGWLWYLICLLPVIGVIQVGLQGRADRYTYLPQIGLYLAATWLVADFASASKKQRRILIGAATIIVAALAWQSWRQTSYWRNTETLWSHALAISADNDIAHYNMAELLLERGQLDEAISHYEKALQARPDDSERQYHLSAALLHNGLANALMRKGRADEALAHYRKAVELRDDFADAHSNLAAILAEKGQTAEAIAQYEKAVALPPEDADSHLSLASILLQTGRDDEAVAHCRRALQIAPHSIAALNALAWALATGQTFSGKSGEEAIALAQKADQLSGGKNAVVLRTLAASYAKSKRFPEAISAAQRALRSTKDPALAQALEQDIKLYEAGAALPGR
jgi:tetratricopeptide (TPR) repeat protein